MSQFHFSLAIFLQIPLAFPQLGKLCSAQTEVKNDLGQAWASCCSKTPNMCSQRRLGRKQNFQNTLWLLYRKAWDQHGHWATDIIRVVDIKLRITGRKETVFLLKLLLTTFSHCRWFLCNIFCATYWQAAKDVKWETERRKTSGRHQALPDFSSWCCQTYWERSWLVF